MNTRLRSGRRRPPLPSIPADVWLDNIVPLLDEPDVLRVSETCRELRLICIHDHVWKRFYTRRRRGRKRAPKRRRYPNGTVSPVDSGFYQRFVSLGKDKQLERLLAQRRHQTNFIHTHQRRITRLQEQLRKEEGVIEDIREILQQLDEAINKRGPPRS